VPTVFLSYASEDRQAARSVGATLRAAGLEVWFDENELGGGDAWDQKIRRQIRECDYFMPLVSAQTDARREGYFRREWRLAVERTLDMADDHLFLLPIVIDATDQASARVPEKFLTVQWLKVPGGQATPAFEALCRRLYAGSAEIDGSTAKPSVKSAIGGSAALAYPPFPKEEPGQRVRFWAQVIGWAAQSIRVAFKRRPRWVRIVIGTWVAIAILSKGCANHRDDEESDKMTRAKVEKLKAIANQYNGSPTASNLAKLGAQIAQEIAADDKDNPAEHRPVLAIPFTAPAGNSAAVKAADSTFAMIYGRLAVEHRGKVELATQTLPTCDLDPALERGRSNRSNYVICGDVDAAAPGLLTVKIAAVGAAAISWSKSYSVANADPAKIAAEVAKKIPVSED
jgi:hypothetical protein